MPLFVLRGVIVVSSHAWGGVWVVFALVCLVCMCVLYVFLVKWRNLLVIEYKNKYNLTNVNDLYIILNYLGSFDCVWAIRLVSNSNST